MNNHLKPNESDGTHEKTHRVPLISFFLWTGLQFGAIFLAFRLTLPQVLGLELASPLSILFWTFAMGLPLSAFEYFYHRYLLHSAVLPFLGAMHGAHRKHHGLTSIKAPVLVSDPAVLVTVHSEFPVEEAHQEESMMFPAYSISIFYGIFLILLALPLKLIFPGEPIVTSVLFAVTLQYTGYEFWHAITHLPYDRFWKPILDGRRTRKISRRIYSFHLMHHWRPACNLAVVGFWGVAIWDYAFRTHRRPKRLPLPGAFVSYVDVTIKKPLFPVSLLDRCSGWFYRSSRKIEAFAFSLFSRKPSS
jgi:hemolysin III